jgi:hypothetical protein
VAEACHLKLEELLAERPTASPLLWKMRQAIVREQFFLSVISTTRA